jgi:hypothetical protein
MSLDPSVKAPAPAPATVPTTESSDQPSLGGVNERLRRVDWSFAKREKAPLIEGVHPYPAKFIGDIPRTLMQLLPVPSGTAVMDPFCGSGTTLVEAQRAGRMAVGVDLNPIACLMSRVKTSPLSAGFLEAGRKVAALARDAGESSVPAIPNVDHWFKKEVQQAVSSLANEIFKGEYLPWLDQLRLALSSILVRVSNQDSDTRYAAVEKNIKRDDVYEHFLAAVSKLEKALNARTWTLEKTKVLQRDILATQPEDLGLPVGLVVTSPPYPNAYEYWLYHKYRMWWLGFDPLAVKEAEIGARAHFFKKNHHTAEMFVGQMEKTLRLVDNVLVRKGFLCVVVGRSKIHGELVDNGTIIQNIAQSLGMESVVRLERSISASRKSFNLSHANIRTETVLVLQKP